MIPAYRETLPGGPSFTVLDQVDDGLADNFPAARVPAGHVFLMGDNRDDSLDSRFSAAEGGIGMVPVENLIGRAIVTFWSTDGSASYWKPWTWFTALRAHAHRQRLYRGRRMSDIAAFVRDRLGHEPNDIRLFELALTHTSIGGGQDYERLEFLGDRVLGHVIARALYDRHPNEPEGNLSRRYNVLVARETCAEIGRELGVPELVRLGKQAREDGASQSDNVVGDVVESLIGALLIDGGFEAAQRFILATWEPHLAEPARRPAASQVGASGAGRRQGREGAALRGGGAHRRPSRAQVHDPGVRAQARRSDRRRAPASRKRKPPPPRRCSTQLQ